MKNVLCCVLLGAAVLGCAPAGDKCAEIRLNSEIERLEKRIAVLEQQQAAYYEEQQAAEDLLSGMRRQQKSDGEIVALQSGAMDALQRQIDAHWGVITNHTAMIYSIRKDNFTNRQAIIRLGTRVAAK